MFNNVRQYLYENSLFLQNIDKFILLSVIAVFVLSTFMSSDAIGFAALVTVFLTVTGLLAKPGAKLTPTNADLWLLAYFMLVLVSLCGSTLFALSFKGFLKTCIYLLFYVSIANFFKDNRGKIPLIMTVIGGCVLSQAIIALLQSGANSNIAEISTWQDVSNLNPEQIMTRVYGTLKPLNPNLLGGYFAAGLPCLIGLSAAACARRRRAHAAFLLTAAVLSVYALLVTGCRGAYLGLVAILAGVFVISAKYLWKRYKKLYLTLAGSASVLLTSAVLSVSSLRARFLSIFAMRQDSSNSFRFNVYHSSWEMFKDNWLLGIGVGNQNFREIYGLYMKTGFDALSAYNVFLEIAVESGVFALIAFGGFLVILLKNGCGFILTSNKTEDIIFVSAALVSICAVTVHGLVDTVFFRPQIQFIFWTMAAWVNETAGKSQRVNL